MFTISIPGTFIAVAGAALLAMLVGAVLKVVDWMLSRDRYVEDAGHDRRHINDNLSHINVSGRASRPPVVAGHSRAA